MLENNFDGGPNGTTITTANSGQAGNDAFDATSSTGTGTVLRFANAIERASAEYCMETLTGSSGTSSYVTWSTSIGAQTSIWTRWYARFDTIPTTTNNDNVMFMAWSGATHCVSIWLNNIGPTLGRVAIYNGVSADTNTVTVLTPDTWNRFEFTATFSTTVASSELRLYLWPDEDATTPTETITQTGRNYSAATANQFRLGCGNPLVSQNSTLHSNWQLNNTGWPGPSPFRAGKGVPGILSNPVAIHADTW